MRLRIFKNTAGELLSVCGEPQSTDGIVYGELLHAVRITWKPGGQFKFLEALAEHNAKYLRSNDMGEA